MSLRTTCLESLRRAALAAVLLVPACEDNTSRPPRSIELTQELQYDPVNASFTAMAALRVNWTFVIERAGVDPADTRRPRYKQEIGPQELLFIGWGRTANGGFGDFSPSDSCVATVSYPQMAPADEARARVGFRL